METMTSKKAKNNDLIHKTDFTKFKPKDVSKKKNQNSKRVDTFLPVSNEDTHKTQPKSWVFIFSELTVITTPENIIAVKNTDSAGFPTFERLFPLIENATTNQQRIPDSINKTH
jgi:hypothetical protein